VIAYTSPDGPAVLKLNRKDDAISVSLAVKIPARLPRPASCRGVHAGRRAI
jgi:hypothetical protein